MVSQTYSLTLGEYKNETPPTGCRDCRPVEPSLASATLESLIEANSREAATNKAMSPENSA